MPLYTLSRTPDHSHKEHVLILVSRSSGDPVGQESQNEKGDNIDTELYQAIDEVQRSQREANIQK